MDAALFQDHDYDCRKGQAFLGLVFLVGGIILVVGTAIAVIILSSVNSSYGLQASQTAETVATAGAEDALLRLTRSNTFSNTYSVNTGGYTATVVVTQNSPAVGKATIYSTATVANHPRKINVIVSLDPTTGQEAVLSWNEVQ